jgi:hypothetical protein
LLKVTIEMISDAGAAGRRLSIGTMCVSDGPDGEDVSDRRVSAVEGANPLAGTPPRIAACVVPGHDRRRAVWVLIRDACEELMKAEWGELCGTNSCERVLGKSEA